MISKLLKTLPNGTQYRHYHSNYHQQVTGWKDLGSQLHCLAFFLSEATFGRQRMSLKDTFSALTCHYEV